MRNKLNSAKNRAVLVAEHIHHYRGRYAVATTFVATVAMFNKMDRLSDWNAFLEEHNLTDAYYLADWE